MEHISENLNSTVMMINDAKVIMDRLHSQAGDLDQSISWFKV